MQGILSAPEDEAFDLVKKIRSSEDLDDVAEVLVARDASEKASLEEADETSGSESDAIRFIGGTSNLLYDDSKLLTPHSTASIHAMPHYIRQDDAVRSWTAITSDVELIIHLLNLYFTWHYSYFTILSKYMFFPDFFRGRPTHGSRGYEYCTPLLVNAMLAIGCHFTSWPAARANPLDSATAGDHFFKEAKRLFLENEEYENPRLATIQALAIMSLREAGCARETKGWLYSGMSFRMAYDMGLNVRSENSNLGEHEVDARRITFWGCFLCDK
jgi:hypothetical protein